ncbi:MAG: hypothetical protein KF771_11675 [Burkholderiales bacterium]|nr:hypothetical protein [Burkholderiales bacterium]
MVIVLWFWSCVLLLFSGLCFLYWIDFLRSYRKIRDFPTSNIATAAQGYVELFGRCELINGTPIHSPFGNVPCCWYQYWHERLDTSTNKLELIKKDNSTAPFLIVDDTGQCVISPQGAHVTANRCRSWSEGSDRHTEWLLLPNDTLYAIGDFTTTGGHLHNDDDEIAEIGSLIDTWKLDRENLHERFDLDRDGIMDQKEWELALLQAASELRKTRSEQSKTVVEGVHRMRKPKDGRPFLLADEIPEKLGQRYLIRACVSLMICIPTGFLAMLLAMLALR